MQPSNAKGRTLRLAMMPLSWAVAFATVYLLFVTLASIEGVSIKGLLRSETLWPLIVFLPGLFFGKTLGLMTTNLIAYVTPPFRRTFEKEVSETGRHSFVQAMTGLAKVLAITGAATLIGAVVFLKFTG